MNKLLVTFLALSIFTLENAYSITVTFEAPCSDKAWFSATLDADSGQTVGDLTLKALKQSGLAFVGSAAGINSINGTVTGLEASEVISDIEMRAYGWCYTVDLVEPTLLPNQFKIKTGTEKIHWFFAYSHYFNGKWLDMCIPVSDRMPDFICEKTK